MKEAGMCDAEATVRFILHDAVTTTCAETGLRPGRAVDKLLDAMMRGLTSPEIKWALRELANDR